jgi:NDP-sugar pyrophosphorylase family protein
VTGFILAAGFGTRLRPITDHIPKALVTVCGIPLLQRWYDLFRAAEFSRIAVNSHHHPGQIDTFIKDGGLDCAVFHETGKIRGTGGALYFAKDFLGQDDYFCVANVDIIAAIDLVAMAATFKNLDCSAGLVTVGSKRGAVWYDKDSLDYAGARSEQTAAPLGREGGLLGAEFLGITFYKREFLDVVDGEDFSILPVWSRAQAKGHAVKIIDAGDAYWIDTGSPGKLARVHFDALDGTNTVAIPAHLKIDLESKIAYPESPVPSVAGNLGPYSWIECSKVPDSAAISRSVVFRDAVVPENAMIQNSLVTKHGVISFGC